MANESSPLLMRSPNAQFFSPKLLWRGGAFFVLCGMATGTIGNHVFKARPGFPADKLEVWSKASNYAIYNGLALLAISTHPRFSVHPFAGPAILLGGALFSSVLFWRGCSDQFPYVRNAAPWGGVAMMAGYLSLLF